MVSIWMIARSERRFYFNPLDFSHDLIHLLCFRVSTIVSGKEGPALQKKIWAELLAKLERIHPGIGQNI